MITSYLLHPSVFGSELKANKKDLLRLFKIILKKNGLVLIDQRAKLVQLYGSQLDTCLDDSRADADEIRRYLDLLFEDAGQSNALQHYAKCKIKNVEDGEVMPSVACSYEPDGVIVAEANSKQMESMAKDGKWSSSVLILSRLGESKVEEYREAEEDAHHLDQMDRKAIEEKFFRFLRYAKRIRFYDPYFAGEAPDQGGPGSAQWRYVEKWRFGIEFILDVVERDSKMRDRNITIDFITKRKSANFRTPDRNHEGISAAKHFRDNIFMPVERRYKEEKNRANWGFECHVKETDGEFRYRYLRTEYGIMNVDKGFDLFERSGNFRENKMRIENDSGTQATLMSWDALPDMQELNVPTVQCELMV